MRETGGNFQRGQIPNILHFDPYTTLTTKTRAKNMGNELSTTKKAKKTLRGGVEIRTRVGLCIVDRGTTLDLLEETIDYVTSS